jgi:hypothetical protein
MADVDAIRLLTEGVDAWNARRGFLDEPVDLTHVKIRNAVLANIDLRGVDLNGAVLEKVDLSGAALSRARLNGVTAEDVLFDDSDLTDADLKGSDFKWVSFRNATLRRVLARQMRIRFSTFHGADLSDAILEGIHVYNSDLSHAVTSGVRVVSTGFLRRVTAEPGGVERFQALGCEIEEAYQPLRHEWHDFDDLDIADADEDRDIIEYESRIYPISAGRYDFFISHASTDKSAIATPLALALEAEGFHVWIDDRFIAPRGGLANIIGFGLKSSRYGIAILSEDYFGRKWTELEYQALSRSELFLILHGIPADRLDEIRPGMSDCVALSSSRGATEIARIISENVRKPRRHLFGDIAQST